VAAQAAVALLCELGSPEDAVALALTTDMSLATSVAARSDDDPLRQRHLWIAIARDIVSRPAPEVGHQALSSGIQHHCSHHAYLPRSVTLILTLSGNP
jgi:hypothetical protein